MAKKFRSPDGRMIECEREVKILKLIFIGHSAYYKSRNHDEFDFVDDKGNRYVYMAAFNETTADYDTKFAQDLASGEGKCVKLTGYFLPPLPDTVNSYIYNPRLLSIADDGASD